MKRKITKNEWRKFCRALKKAFGESVELHVNDNTHLFLNAHFIKKRWVVRLHWMFLKGPKAFAAHIARYTLKREKKSSKIIDRYIEDHWHWVRHPLPPITTRGSHYDLTRLLKSLNRRYLNNKVTAKITWGQKSLKNFRGQLQMGSYSTSRNLITIHPRLDQKFVPKCVIEATIFHEMCHALLPIERLNGRRQIHPPKFYKLELRYPHLEKAKRWEEKNLGRLLKKGR